MIFNINQNTTKKEYKPCYLLAKLKEDFTVSTTEQTLYFEKWKQRGSGLFINNDGTFEAVHNITFNIDLKIYCYDGFTADSSLQFYLYDTTFRDQETLLNRFFWNVPAAKPYKHITIKFPYVEDNYGDTLYKIKVKVDKGGGRIRNVSTGDTTLLMTELFNEDNR